jgi:IS5 family transposase
MINYGVNFGNLFGQRPICDMVNPNHPLLILSNAINWDNLTTEIGKFYNDECGRPCLNLRLMIGLLILQKIGNISDEKIVQAWTDTPVYQLFTGNDIYTTTPPCCASSLTYFRKRIGVEGCEIIFKESVAIFGQVALDPEVIIDTTVQEKYIAFPTDTKLALDVIEACRKYETHFEFKFEIDYIDEVDKLRRDINFSKGEMKLPIKLEKIKILREIAIILINEVKNKVPDHVKIDEQFIQIIENWTKAVTQETDGKNKIYSIYEPHVSCVKKGKILKNSEFGDKISLIIGKESKIVLGAINCPGNPHDGKTLEPALDQLQRLHNGFTPAVATADLGYRGHPEVNGVRIITPDLVRKTDDPAEIESIKGLLHDRSKIEPIIGHIKHDHGLKRNKLHGLIGNFINALLSATAFNMVKYINTFTNTIVNIVTVCCGKKHRQAPLKTRAVPFAKYIPVPELLDLQSVLVKIERPATA